MNRVNGIIFWIILYTLFIVFVQKYFLVDKDNDFILKRTYYDVPLNVKCVVQYDNCEYDNIDGLCLLFGVVSMIIGYLYPNKVLLFLITIFAAEFSKQIFDINPRFIINPCRFNRIYVRIMV